MTREETFLAVYEKHLLEQVKTHPERYAYGPDKVPAYVQQFKYALRTPNNFNLTGAALKLTCKELQIKVTYKAIREYLHG